MKILEVISLLMPGGAERFVVDLSNELARTHEVWLMTLQTPEPAPGQRMFYRSLIGEQVHFVHLDIPKGFSLKEQWRVRRAITEINPDVVHYHLHPTLKYGVFAIFTLAHRYKSYWTIHNDLRKGYDKGIFRWMMQVLGRRQLMRVVCISPTNHTAVKGYYPFLDCRCIVNGRAPIEPTDRFEDVQKEMASYRSRQDALLLLHVARCHEQKNQQLLIEAVNAYRQRTGDKGQKPIDLVVIGADFDSHIGQHLQSLAGENIHFIGMRTNVDDYMLCADLFCLSSLHEGMPITLIEASLAGLPMVSTPVCGAVDIIKNGVNGYLSTDFTLPAYVDVLRQAQSHVRELKAQSLALRDDNTYTIAHCAGQYIQYFYE